MSHKKDTTRREFIKTAATMTAGVSTLSSLTLITRPERVFGANDRVRVGVCGLHGRGKDHIDAFARVPHVEIAALCDVDESVLNKRREELGGRPRTFVDIRQLLDDPTIDAISIATPNHWHALMGIWACQASKDVYIEKPCSHNLWEGRQLVRAAQKYRRIVQHGTQSRSAPAMIDAIKHVRGGTFGEIYMARGLCFKRRDTIGHAEVEPVPRGVDYNLWTGPAPLKPFTRNRFHYNWHWLFDTGNGDLGNQGVHQIDAARWGLGVGFPNRICAMGGHFMFDDDQETPNTQISAFHYPDEKKMLVFEVRHWMTNPEDVGTLNKSDSNSIGVIFYGSDGYMVIPSYTAYKVFLGKKREPGPEKNKGGDHYLNFISAMRSRKTEDLHAPAVEGHQSAALCHLANIAYRTRKALEFDPKAERFVGDNAANAMLTREYRKPYVVPDKV